MDPNVESMIAIYNKPANINKMLCKMSR